MARDRCTLDYKVRRCIFPGYEPMPGKKLLIDVPDQCKNVSFLNRLKYYFGFSYLFLPMRDDYRDLAYEAGWLENELVINPCCNSTIREIDNSLYRVPADHSRGIREYHAIYVDEPHKLGIAGYQDPSKLEEIYNHIKEAYIKTDGTRIEFIIGEYAGWWMEDWGKYSDSICYSGYQHHTYLRWGCPPCCFADPRSPQCDFIPVYHKLFYTQDPDQRDNWTDVHSAGRSGNRAWISLRRDQGEFDTLLHHANNLEFNEIWVFSDFKEFGNSCDEIERNLPIFLEAAVRNDWLKKRPELCEDIIKQKYCIFQDCYKCDPDNPEHWSFMPLRNVSRDYPRGMEVFQRDPWKNWK